MGLDVEDEVTREGRDAATVEADVVMMKVRTHDVGGTDGAVPLEAEVTGGTTVFAVGPIPGADKS